MCSSDSNSYIHYISIACENLAGSSISSSVSVSVGFCTKAAWGPHFQAGRVTCCDIVQE